jgi:Tfp pilus assembly protein PilX
MTTRFTIRPHRRGFAVAAVLVCLLAITLIGAGMVQSLIEAQRSSRLAHDRLQALWLAESGVDRAVARLRTDNQYKGETWTLAAEEFDGRRGAVVEIAVEPAGDSGDNVRQIVVTATIGEGPHRVTAECRRPFRDS